MSGRYGGNLRVELTHEPSGTRIHTAAPVDNHGDGSSFSPTDLVAASLGACMVTIIAIVAERDGIDCSGLGFTAEKHMASSGARRIGAVPVRLQMPAGLSTEQKGKLERAALTCPVHHSLVADIEKNVTFVYPEAT